LKRAFVTVVVITHDKAIYLTAQKISGFDDITPDMINAYI